MESFPINLKAIVPSSSGLPPLYTSLYIPPFLAPVQRGGGENGETQKTRLPFFTIILKLNLKSWSVSNGNCKRWTFKGEFNSVNKSKDYKPQFLSKTVCNNSLYRDLLERGYQPFLTLIKCRRYLHTYFQKYTYVFITRGILAGRRDSFSRQMMGEFREHKPTARESGDFLVRRILCISLLQVKILSPMKIITM